MTETAKIKALRVLIDDTECEEDEGVLSVYLQLAGDKILNRMYPYKDDYTGLNVPDKYTGVQLKAAAFMMLKRGAEGEIQHIEGNIHRNFGAADLPEAILQEVVPFCQAIR